MKYQDETKMNLHKHCNILIDIVFPVCFERYLARSYTKKYGLAKYPSKGTGNNISIKILQWFYKFIFHGKNRIFSKVIVKVIAHSKVIVLVPEYILFSEYSYSFLSTRTRASSL